MAEGSDRLFFHYTSLDALVSIVESGVLWASDLHFLNDGREYTYAVEAVETVLRRRGPDRTEDADFLDRALRALRKSAASSVFVASFSESEDSLSQWRAYCPPARGVSLGFREDLLREACREQGFELAQCSYDAAAHAAVAGELVDDFFNQYDQLDLDPKETDVTSDLGELIAIFLNDFGLIAPTMKDPSFGEEREWRVVKTAGTAHRWEDRYRAGRSFLVPFIEFKLPRRLSSPAIERVVIGPTPHPDLSARSVLRLLASRRITFAQRSVQVSGVPYRAW